jgi:hypothetical protein
MILIVKGKSYKNLIRKVIAMTLLVTMFSFYYIHMSNKFKEEKQKLETELILKNEIIENKKKLKSKVNRLVYNEAEQIVDLIGQKHIQSIKIKNDRLIIVCDWDTDIEPLFIRYGVMALVKSTPENIKIAIELKFIVESRYEV